MRCAITHAATDSNRPDWWAYAQKAIRRLQQDEAEHPLSRGTMKLGGTRRGFGFDDDLPAQLGASADVPPASPLSILSAVPDLRHLPPEDWDAIADAGGDPAATTERADALPPGQVPWRDLLVAIQLAASVGSAERLDAMLQARAVTLLTGVAEDDLKLTAQMLTHLIPEDWLIHFEGSNDINEKCLSVIKPRVTDGKIGLTAARDYLPDVVKGLQSSKPLLIVQTTTATLPADLPIDRLGQITLMPVARRSGRDALHQPLGNRADRRSARSRGPARRQRAVEHQSHPSGLRNARRNRAGGGGAAVRIGGHADRIRWRGAPPCRLLRRWQGAAGCTAAGARSCAVAGGHHRLA